MAAEDLDYTNGIGHLEGYFQHVLKQEGERGLSHVETMRETCGRFLDLRIRDFSNQHSSKLLLMGEVQSGKTAQMLAVIAATADESDLFKTFVLLTTSNIALHQQTLFRCIESLPTFEVCGERDELRFRANANKRPALIVLKKNSPVLKRWRNNLLSTALLQGRPLFILDDEADASSLNTAVNRGEQSKINEYLDEIVAAASSSVFVQVTATPQALFLQADSSGWKPQDSMYFPHGSGYLGGKFFFSDPPPYSYRRTAPGELLRLTSRSKSFSELPNGFRESVANYLVSSSHFLATSGGITTFLIHPSWTTDVHSRIHGKLLVVLKSLIERIDEDEIQSLIRKEWIDLQKSFPALLPFEEILSLIKQSEHKIHILNSDAQNSVLVEFQPGSNIIIGGNSLGRGLTFPMLLTVYYCRESRIPQQDTIWQHCRMFGYDRVAGLSRMFMPGDLFDLFSETHAANDVLVKLVSEGKAADVQILTGTRARPTRRSVVDQSLFSQFVGGVNYFPNSPDQEKWGDEYLDTELERLSPDDADLEVPIEEFFNIFGRFESSNTGEWSTSTFLTALKMYMDHRGAKKSGLILIRRNRDVAFGTGTLLSANDRNRTLLTRDKPVLVLYRLNGSLDKGWDGRSFWVPNIKLPDGFVFNFLGS
jgi:hypothetical protein